MISFTRNLATQAVRTVKAKIKAKKPKRPKKIKRKPSEFVPLPIYQFPISQQDDRRLYSWGLANHGALGTLSRAAKSKLKDEFNFISRPSRLYFGEHYKVVDVACGYGFTLIGVESKDNLIVYGCGVNTDSQLGYDENDEKRPTFKNHTIPVPRAIQLPIKDNTTKVTGLAAGRAHSLILTSEGLFTLGNNAYGQCGRQIILTEDYYLSRVVNYIKDIDGEKISAVAAGQDHSVALTEAGKVYTFGWGADGQTGLGHYLNEWKPSPVQGELEGEKIIKVSCVADCILALSESGKVYGWGNAEYGQLPVDGDNYQVNRAVEISDCAACGKIVDIAAGGSFCMILLESGDVYVWGFGILGFGPKVARVTQPTLIPNTLFGRNPYQKDIQVKKIYCGMSQMAAITNHGDLYSWGRNKFGNLGLHGQKDQFFPLKVGIGAQVVKFSCGVDHCFAICKPYI